MYYTPNIEGIPIIDAIKYGYKNDHFLINDEKGITNKYNPVKWNVYDVVNSR